MAEHSGAGYRSLSNLGPGSPFANRNAPGRRGGYRVRIMQAAHEKHLPGYVLFFSIVLYI